MEGNIYDPHAEPEKFVDYTLEKVKKGNSILGDFYYKLFNSLYDINSSFFEDNFEVLEDKIDGYFRREVNSAFPELGKSLVEIRKNNPSIEFMKGFYVQVLADIYLNTLSDEKLPKEYTFYEPIVKFSSDLKNAYLNEDKY
ncbi:MAG: hypothetical protein ACOCP4_02525 [Candidatus Woesearchaeota archaeon]